jgi:hypothetical protein
LPSRFQIVILKEDSNMKVINNSNVGWTSHYMTNHKIEATIKKY